MVVHFVRYTAGVVRNSLPILGAVIIVAAVLVYSPQGRAFLLIEGFGVTAYVVLFGTIQMVLYAYVLADPVSANHADDGAQAAETRLRWLALWCGARIVGLLGGLLLPCLLEDFVARNSKKLATAIRTSMDASTALLVLLVATILLAELVWRIAFQKTEGTRLRDVSMLVWTVMAIWIANHMNYLWLGHRFTFYLLLLLVGLILSSLLALPGNGSQQAVGGGVMGWLNRWIWIVAAGVWLVAGSVLAIRPDFATGTGWVVFTVLQFWIALAVILTVLLKWGWNHHNWKPFVMACVVAVALVGAIFSFLGHALHARDVRKLEVAAITPPHLADVARQWLEDRRSKIECPKQLSERECTKQYPVVLVAAAGGGIRAAYWTAGLLTALQDANDAFAHHVFALSGVSGGSVGAGVFTALVKARCSGCRKQAAAILGKDFLAPILSTMLLRDVWSATFRTEWPDRAVTLEEAFERAWSETIKTHWLSERLEHLWSGDDTYRVPNLFLNVTEAESVKRVVISNVSVAGVESLDGALQQVVEAQAFRLSTAVVLSARFPYVSPEAKLTWEGHTLRLVDGGFVDNSGAATLIDILQALDGAAKEVELQGRLQFAVLLIENEPIETSALVVQKSTGGIGTPLAILDKIRSAQTDQFKRDLYAMVAARGGIVLDGFRPESGAAEFPLGWTLPEATRKEMDAQIGERLSAKNGAIVEILRLLENGRATS